jgi:hypothetical protein
MVLTPSLGDGVDSPGDAAAIGTRLLAGPRREAQDALARAPVASMVVQE